MAAVTSASLRESQSALIAEAKEILAAESPSPEQRSRFDAIEVEVGKVEERIAAFERIEQAEARNRASAGVVSGDLPHTDPKNTRDGKHQYSLTKAILEQADGKLSGLERETSDTLAKRSKSTPKGFYLPFDVVSPERRDIGTGLGTTTGSGALKTAVADTVIEQLRARTLIDQLGVQMLTDVEGTFKLPKQSALAQIFWVGAGADVAQSNAAIQKQVTFTPKTVGSWQDIGRRFLSMSSLDGELWVRNQLLSALGLGIDLAAFVGGTDEDEPIGIFNLPDVHDVEFGPNATTGGVPSWAKIVAMETAVESANALGLGSSDSFAYVMHPKLKGLLKTTPKLSGSQFADFIYSADGRVNGYKAYSSTQIPANLMKGYDADNPTSSPGDGPCAGMVFGHFPSLTVALYTGIDVITDVVTGAKSGTIRITALQDCDIQSRYDEAFAIALDAKV